MLAIQWLQFATLHYLCLHPLQEEERRERKAEQHQLSITTH